MPPGHPGPSPTRLGHSPPINQIYCKDERTKRQYIKLKRKHQDKHKLDSMQKDLVNGLRRPTAKDKDMNSVGTSEDGEESSIPDEEDSVQIIADILSSVQAPKVRFFVIVKRRMTHFLISLQLLFYKRLI